MLVSRLFAEDMKRQDKKNMPIVSFIDWAVDHPYRNYDVYLASKAALRHYLMALQSSFAGYVRVVNIQPGMILEPPNFLAAQKESIMKNTPTQGIGTPQQAAQLVHTALELDFLADTINLAGGQQWRHRL
jgi:NAD(P)-dependent dehydrogenase (short-subunit alcohol dehydrogenase family)